MAYYEKKFFHLTGDKAYQVLWDKLYKGEVVMEVISLEVTDPEVIIDEDGELIAYRNDSLDRYGEPEFTEWEWEISDPELEPQVFEFLRVSRMTNMKVDFGETIN